MNNFWTNTMENLLGTILYHRTKPDEKTWVKQYTNELEHMINDMIDYYNTNTESGFVISVDDMSNFLIYEEWRHIGNTHLVKRKPINKKHINQISKKILFALPYCRKCKDESASETIRQLFNEAIINGIDELDVYMSMLERGIDVEAVRLQLGDDSADHMQRFCEEHGLI